MVKKITPKRLENIALYYLERYDSSAFKLKSVLERRVFKAKRDEQEVDENASAWIESIVQKMQDLGYVNDERYAQNQFRILSNAHKSVRYIVQKLKQDGIDEERIRDLFESQEQSTDELDLNAARLLISKKKIGKYRSVENRKLMYQKDLSALGRAGFSYDIARQALQED